jgi:hypothetical protein
MDGKGNASEISNKVLPDPKPLDHDQNHKQIRLLNLLPDFDYRGKIQCTTQHLYLNEAPPYQALSYCWGESTNNDTILCNTIEIAVTDNLHAALYRLRRPDTSRLLCIDTICINQSDHTEKSHQVQLMREIYERSDRALVWLGEETQNIEFVWPLVERVRSAYKAQLDAADEQSYLKMDCETRSKFEIPPLSDPGYHALSMFLDSPWCKRVWVVQEVVAAPKVAFIRGRYTLEGSWIMVTVIQIHRLEMSILFPFRFAAEEFMMISWKKVQKSKMGFLLTLLIHRFFQATNPRDKVFALCGISNNVGTHQIDIAIDYSSTTEDVYISTAKAILEHHRDLTLLRVPAPFIKSATSQLPSWVPDWRTFDRDTYICIQEGKLAESELPRSNATKGSKASISFERNTLKIAGIEFDQIAITGEIYKGDREEIHLQLHRYVNWEALANVHSGKSYFNGECIKDAYYHTLTYGYFLSDSSDANFFQEYDRQLEDLKTLWEMRCTSSSLIGESELEKLENALWVHEVSKCLKIGLNRMLVKTERGFLGLAHGSARPGDRIMLCKGSEVPLVLRKEGEIWTLVGECYVHGIMNGEAFEEEKCQPIVLC